MTGSALGRAQVEQFDVVRRRKKPAAGGES